MSSGWGTVSPAQEASWEEELVPGPAPSSTGWDASQTHNAAAWDTGWGQLGSGLEPAWVGLSAMPSGTTTGSTAGSGTMATETTPLRATSAPFAPAGGSSSAAQTGQASSTFAADAAPFVPASFGSTQAGGSQGAREATSSGTASGSQGGLSGATQAIAQALASHTDHSMVQSRQQESKASTPEGGADAAAGGELFDVPQAELDSGEEGGEEEPDDEPVPEENE